MASVYSCRGLESEGRGLPGDVSSGAIRAGFTAARHCALTIPTILCHAPTMHRGVKVDVHSGPSDLGAWTLHSYSLQSVQYCTVSDET